MKPKNAFVMAVLVGVFCFGLHFTYADDSGCNLSQEASAAVATLLSPNPKFSDGFGWCVAVDGATIAVGGDLMKAVHVFVQETGGWAHQATLRAPDGEPAGRFGNAVAVDGDTIAVGAPFPGAVYVFVRSGTTWTQEARLTVSEDVPFGVSVAISGNLLVAGANNANTGGSAYVFERQGTGWQQVAVLLASDPQGSINFGCSVDIEENTILVGASEHDGGGIYSGAAYVFVNNNGWVQQAKITALDAGEENYFGHSVALAGNRALIGAYGDSHLALHAGSAYVFVRNGTTWTQEAKINNPEPGPEHAFGFSVGLDGETAIVGAYGAGGTTGAAFVFERTSQTGWTVSKKLRASQSTIGDWFGWSVALNGETLLAGAPFRNMLQGAAFVFRNSRSVRDPVPDIKANGSDGPIAISPFEALSVSVSLDPGDYNGSGADWLIVAATPFGWYYYDVIGGHWDWRPGIRLTHQGPLFTVDRFPVLNAPGTFPGLPRGSYMFLFFIDMNMNGMLDFDQGFFDSVQVYVR